MILRDSYRDKLSATLLAAGNRKKALIIFFALFGVLAVLSCLKYYNLRSSYYDLGVFLNNFAMAASGQWTRMFLSHVQPLTSVFSFLFRIFSGEAGPIFVLISQAAVLSLPVIGLYLNYNLITTLAYVLYFPLWYNALFDFHMDHFAVAVLFGFFIFERQGKIRLAVCMAVLLAMVKEIFALQAAFCGLYLLMVRKQRLTGTALMVFGVLYFFITTHYLQKYFNSHFTFIYGGWDIISAQRPYAWLGSNFGDIILSILTQAHLVIWEIISEKGKIVYLFYTLGALGFIPLLRPGVLLVSVPVIMASLLSQVPNHYGFNHHYTAGLIAPFVIAFGEGLPKAMELWKRWTLKEKWFLPTLISGLFFCHVMLSPSPISRKFFLKKAWFYHYTVYIPLERDSMIKEAIREYVPTDPETIVTTQNTVNWNYLTRRKNIFVFPDGVTKTAYGVHSPQLTWSGFWNFVITKKINPPLPEVKEADYVVLDLKRPWFLGARGCHWIAGKCHDSEDMASEFLEQVQETKRTFEVVFEKDGFLILKRPDE